MDEFGIRPSGLRLAQPFTMTGVSPDADKPHILKVHHLGLSNPAVMTALIKGAPLDATTEKDVVEKLATRAQITWENVCAPDGTPLAAEPARVERYLRSLIEAGYGQLIIDLWQFAQDPANFGASTTDPAALGKA